ncbi:DUF2887 domain-containing protein [Synechococcus sp. EJ6-Ellesmere]|uniref:DUF2887 domain-containing protein n=1 Tax=Synechococcus sp. EJ6-Ellesmere TaxID=2823734 RepID=UPI0028F4198E|nr:DUF2887 domain-containing protein [Synechococcus sp. EJ6-Ellesmere]MCP9824899.1 DUF2887 domain-containing protein [Synechococcus sp. EJ6-Ellesmere]
MGRQSQHAEPRPLSPRRQPLPLLLLFEKASPTQKPCGYEALELKELSHRLDGVLWPRPTTGCAETGSPEFPVVLLEGQMHPDPGFHHRLAAQTHRFLQRHPQVEHWSLLVVMPHNRLNVGPSPAPPIRLRGEPVAMPTFWTPPAPAFARNFFSTVSGTRVEASANAVPWISRTRSPQRS